jgi:AcrR family transcriptional regulator
MATRRAAQAEATRRDIVRAARQLFVEHGYEATSMKDIAAAADVSVQTIYDSVGGKAALITAINEAMSAEVGTVNLIGDTFENGSVQDLLELQVRISLAYVQHSGDLLRVAGGTAEPAVHEIMVNGRRRHAAGARRIADALGARGALRPGLEVAAAADILAVVTDPQYLMILRDGYRWNVDRIRTFVLDALRALLLA